VTCTLLAVILRPFWVILKRVGLNHWLSLLMLIPLINLLALYYIAYAKWPNGPNRIPGTQN